MLIELKAVMQKNETYIAQSGGESLLGILPNFNNLVYLKLFNEVT